MKQVKVIDNFKSYKDGTVLVLEKDVEDISHLTEGELFVLTNGTEEYGIFYFGRQHRGIGFKVEGAALNEAFFVRLFQESLEARTSLYKSPATNAFRLYNGEGDGLGGFTIDNYDGHLLIQWYSQGIYTYQDMIVRAVKHVFPYKSIHEKLRNGDEVITNQLTEESPEFPIIVTENHLFYTINFYDGPMTGIFLDQRDVRAKILKMEGKTMLNLFAYSGGFSIAAAKAGMQTTSVDIAKRSLELIEQNFGLNGLDASQHERYSLDVFEMFKYLKRKNRNFDLIVIDPPSFSRSKKRRFTVKEHYHELLEGSLPLLNGGGTIIASTNASNYPLTKFKKMIEETMKASGRTYEIVDVMGLPKDFKTTNQYKPSKYLKVVFIHVLD